MTGLTIRNLDDELMAKLRVEAALHGNSLEEEACAIVRKALGDRPAITGFGSRIVQRFSAIGGVELDLPPRGNCLWCGNGDKKS